MAAGLPKGEELEGRLGLERDREELLPRRRREDKSFFFGPLPHRGGAETNRLKLLPDQAQKGYPSSM